MNTCPRYRLVHWVPSLKGRFAHIRYRVAVHALTVRALTAAEIGVLSGLNRHEVRGLLSELQLMGALQHDDTTAAPCPPGRDGGAATLTLQRPRSKALVAVRRWLTGPYRTLAQRRRAGASVWLSTVHDAQTR